MSYPQPSPDLLSPAKQGQPAEIATPLCLTPQASTLQARISGPGRSIVKPRLANQCRLAPFKTSSIESRVQTLVTGKPSTHQSSPSWVRVRRSRCCTMTRYVFHEVRRSPFIFPCHLYAIPAIRHLHLSTPPPPFGRCPRPVHDIPVACHCPCPLHIAPRPLHAAPPHVLRPHCLFITPALCTGMPLCTSLARGLVSISRTVLMCTGSLPPPPRDTPHLPANALVPCCPWGWFRCPTQPPPCTAPL
ncbi:hypothetical protein GGX14DRAFT_569551 [Mycena pura]|uniref:Uncharacterized protein n=1 Tax=Mycena pura TaxID=153505 RepID=A0AAD6Y6Q6_9AGAR|nr:hypothetical protein GGX14DRAFT_569551 [Mycena pura]